MSAAAAPTRRGGGRGEGGGGGGLVGWFMWGKMRESARRLLGVLRAALGSLERQTEESCTLERGALHAQEGCGPNLISLL